VVHRRVKDEVRTTEHNRFVESYRTLLRRIDEIGGGQDILFASRRSELFPTLFSANITPQDKLAFTQALDKLQRYPDLIATNRPLLEVEQADLASTILKQYEDTEDARVRTRDRSLSTQESYMFFAIAEKVVSEFPDSYMCVCDSYQTVAYPPSERMRSAAVIWNGFSADSWARRFAKLKRLSCRPFILVGVTCDEIEQNRFPGISSRIKNRTSLRVNTSTKRYLSRLLEK